ncbi:HDIG domain-containing protein [Gracilibacillus salitolerans]|uniref:HDIG domain-containing protein n=1 Tax=Gracilibacillus salitolerans TaxID=2663022 RepID=A0A5Q2TLK4_9BACI|nr:HDIG domain-containing metalloprotein [Gracilibacillus salitolerans]QGH34967.1 HDIG domain-containing protein [Gracilibacillus salitolerans]
MEKFWLLKQKIVSFFQDNLIQLVTVCFVIVGIFFVVSYQNVHTETYDIEKFSAAKETIRSPITIENTRETERRLREVIQSVEDHFEISEEVTEEQITYINEVFEAVDKIETGNIELELEEEKLVSIADKVAYLENIVHDELLLEVDTQTFRALFQATDEERVLAKELITTALYDAYYNGIKVEEVDQAIQTAQQKLTYSTLDDSFVQALRPLIAFSIQPNSFFSADLTNEAQQQARNSVEPVMIRAGEVIVEEGQLITNEIYEELEVTGLLNEQRNFYPTIGLLLLVTLLGLFLFFELRHHTKKSELHFRKLIAICVLSIFIVLMMKVVSFYTTSVNPLYLVTPVATVSMLLKILVNERIAIVMSVFYAVIGSVIFNADIPGLLNMEAGIFIIFSQLASIFFLSVIKDRGSIIKSGLATSIINMVTICLFLFLSFEKYSWLDYLSLSGYGFLSAIIATVLTMGMLPFFESGLRILSDTKLLALSSPNQPLLRKLLIEAPGTYHHSIMVANLSEASCEAIGANGLLARVAAYYHDLGKTVRPHYFIENQMRMKNPHDYLDPYQSAEIILQHPVDSAKLLKKEKLPNEIIDIALQHHGTTLLKYFYFKAKERNDKVNEEDFRYDGPKPKTKEAAVVSICDSIEAAARSLATPTQDEIEKVVSSILEDRLLDGQLNDSTLTFKELEQMKLVICETLKGIYHSRIQYPKETNMKEAR